MIDKELEDLYKSYDHASLRTRAVKILKRIHRRGKCVVATGDNHCTTKYEIRIALGHFTFMNKKTCCTASKTERERILLTVLRLAKQEIEAEFNMTQELNDIEFKWESPWGYAR